MSKVIVGMSGGVDSSVAAALLKEQGYDVVGVTMKIWVGGSGVEGKRHGCYGPGEEEDIADAQRVAQILGFPLYIVDLTREYKTEIVDYFCHEYMSGRTPNPCVRCNRMVKFGALLSKTREIGIDFGYFATGHYARIEHDDEKGRFLLKKARDLNKDQSYFLYALSQEQLGCALFPVGGYRKEEVRKLAAKFGLGVENKAESQNFAGGDYSPLTGSEHPGPILDKQGKVLGEHRGIQFYTVGQRKGMGVSAAEPLYVTGIDAGCNAIIVGSKSDVYSDELVASHLNWIEFDALEQPIEIKAKIRYRHREGEAVVTPISNGEVNVKFAQPQMAITPGQAVVFYRGATVVGGGTIERAGI